LLIIFYPFFLSFSFCSIFIVIAPFFCFFFIFLTFLLISFLRWNYPHLHDHFVDIKLSPEVLTTQWFVTLFCYSFPLSMTLKLWDYMFLTGWEGIFRLAVSILGLMEKELLALEDMESVAMLMKEWKKPNYLSSYFSYEELLDKANSLIITEEVLLKLQESYASEILIMSVILKYLHDHPEDSKDSSHSPKSSSDHNNGDSIPMMGDISSKNILKKALPPGVEPPTFWLMRYGYKLSREEYSLLASIHSELLSMDRQIDSDKQVLSQKILKACELHREVEENIEQMEQSLSDLQSSLVTSNQRFHSAVEEAQMIASKGATIIDTLAGEYENTSGHNDNSNNNINNPQQSPQNSTKQQQKQQQQQSQQSEKKRNSSQDKQQQQLSPQSNQFNLAKKIPLLTTGPLRRLLFKKRYAEAKQMTTSLNEVLEKASQIIELEEKENKEEGIKLLEEKEAEQQQPDEQEEDEFLDYLHREERHSHELLTNIFHQQLKQEVEEHEEKEELLNETEKIQKEQAEQEQREQQHRRQSNKEFSNDLDFKEQDEEDDEGKRMVSAGKEGQKGGNTGNETTVSVSPSSSPQQRLKNIKSFSTATASPSAATERTARRSSSGEIVTTATTLRSTSADGESSFPHKNNNNNNDESDKNIQSSRSLHNPKSLQSVSSFHERETARKQLLSESHRLSKKIDTFGLLHNLQPSVKQGDNNRSPKFHSEKYSRSAEDFHPVQPSFHFYHSDSNNNSHQSPSHQQSPKALHPSHSASSLPPPQHHPLHKSNSDPPRPVVSSSSSSLFGTTSPPSSSSSSHLGKFHNTLFGYAKRWTAPHSHSNNNVNNSRNTTEDESVFLEEEEENAIAEMEQEEQQNNKHNSHLSTGLQPLQDLGKHISTSVESIGNIFSQHLHINPFHPNQQKRNQSQDDLPIDLPQETRTGVLAQSSQVKKKRKEIRHQLLFSNCVFLFLQLKNLELASQKAQERILKSHKALEYYKRTLFHCEHAYQELKVRN
jgi:hypothetical protein